MKIQLKKQILLVQLQLNVNQHVLHQIVQITMQLMMFVDLLNQRYLKHQDIDQYQYVQGQYFVAVLVVVLVFFCYYYYYYFLHYHYQDFYIL
eukprot:UN02612